MVSSRGELCCERLLKNLSAASCRACVGWLILCGRVESFLMVMTPCIRTGGGGQMRGGGGQHRFSTRAETTTAMTTASTTNDYTDHKYCSVFWVCNDQRVKHLRFLRVFWPAQVIDSVSEDGQDFGVTYMGYGTEGTATITTLRQITRSPRPVAAAAAVKGLECRALYVGDGT